jgi:hypothetical protein
MMLRKEEIKKKETNHENSHESYRHDVSVTVTKNDRKSESKRIDFNRLDGLGETVEIRQID